MDNKEQTGQDDFSAQARKFLDRGLYHIVRDLAEARLAALPGDIEGRVILCEALWGMGYDEEAQELIREIEEIIRGYSEIYGIMGKICQKRGLVREAILYYRRYLDLNPHTPKLPEITRQLAALQEQEAAAGKSDAPPVMAGDSPEEPTRTMEPPPAMEPPTATTLQQWLNKLEDLQKKKS